MEAALPLTHGFWLGLNLALNFGLGRLHFCCCCCSCSAAVAVPAQIINLTNCLGDWQTKTAAAAAAPTDFTEHQQQIVICI